MQPTMTACSLLMHVCLLFRRKPLIRRLNDFKDLRSLTIHKILRKLLPQMNEQLFLGIYAHANTTTTTDHKFRISKLAFILISWRLGTNGFSQRRKQYLTDAKLALRSQYSTTNPAQPSLSLPVKGGRGERDAGGVDGTENSGEMEGKIITCCLCMCPIPALFPWRRGLAGVQAQHRCNRPNGRGTGVQKIERHTRWGMREVYREKNTGIWTTRSRVLRAVVNAENKHRAAAADTLEDKNYESSTTQRETTVAQFCDPWVLVISVDYLTTAKPCKYISSADKWKICSGAMFFFWSMNVKQG